MEKTSVQGDVPASRQIDDMIAGLTDWRGKTVASLRQIIREASPGIAEEWKWGTAVWSQKGIVCSVAAFKDHVKLHFFQGAALADPKGLFNAGQEAKAMRAIDFGENSVIDRTALQELLREAVAYDQSRGERPGRGK
jgi:hypothetical protein